MPDSERLSRSEASDWTPFEGVGPTVGYCSKCGEAREAFYTCRGGGETIPKEADDA